jgi:methylated-DNA-[protein]-cysteine S-methyltransferase
MVAMTDIEIALRSEDRDLGPVLDALIAQAEADDLVDVAYVEEDSPIGRLTLAATPRGLVRIAFETEDEEHVLEDLAARISPRVLRAPHRLDRTRQELEEYFDGRRTSFDLPLDRTLSRGFRLAALEAMSDIPFGHVATYKDIAEAAGNVRATRAAGSACATNPIPVVVPCHRVLAAGGRIGGYAGGLDRKHFLLRLEGVELDV